ncbi:MAG: hypothetical protein ACFFE3_09420 [Candidatus Thorarchaeota archaeon]
MKALARAPYMLMLKDESGEVNAVRLDAGLVNSDNALIVLDEFNDTCWVWIGKNVNMPTRMHSLRIARGLQKSGYQVGVTTIGLAASRFVEMHEKDDSDSDVASAIVEFRGVLEGRWSFDDKVLAHKGEAKVAEPIAGAPTKKLLPPEPEPEPIVKVPEPIAEAPEPAPTLVAETIDEPTPAVSASLAEKKMAYLMLSVTRNSDLVYTERFVKGGKKGLKIESPGVMVIEALFDGDSLEITPKDFGGSETGLKIKSEYEGLSKRL